MLECVNDNDDKDLDLSFLHACRFHIGLREILFYMIEGHYDCIKFQIYKKEK